MPTRTASQLAKREEWNSDFLIAKVQTERWGAAAGPPMVEGAGLHPPTRTAGISLEGTGVRKDEVRGNRNLRRLSAPAVGRAAQRGFARFHSR